MTIRERFWIGLYLASGSFWMLWMYKKLLVYLSSIIFIFYIVPLFFKNTQLFGFAYGEFLSFNVSFDLGSFIYVYLLTFSFVALIAHVLAIMQGNVTIGVRSIIKSIAPLWSTMLLWSLLLTTVLFLFRKVTVLAAVLPTWLVVIVNGVAVVLLLGFLFTCFLLLPVIAAERQGLIVSMKRSAQLVRTVFVEIIAALCWVSIIAALALLILLMVMNAANSALFRVIVFLLALLCGHTIYSAVAVMQALLYQRSIQLIR